MRSCVRTKTRVNTFVFAIPPAQRAIRITTTAMRGDAGTDPTTETLDVSNVLQLVDPSRMDRMHVVFVPYSLLESGRASTELRVNLETLTIGAIDFAPLE